MDNDLVNSKLFYRKMMVVFLFHMIIYQKNGIIKCKMMTQKIANLAYRLQKDFEKWMINTITLG